MTSCRRAVGHSLLRRVRKLRCRCTRRAVLSEDKSLRLSVRSRLKAAFALASARGSKAGGSSLSLTVRSREGPLPSLVQGSSPASAAENATPLAFSVDGPNNPHLRAVANEPKTPPPARRMGFAPRAAKVLIDEAAPAFSASVTPTQPMTCKAPTNSQHTEVKGPLLLPGLLLATLLCSKAS